MSRIAKALVFVFSFGFFLSLAGAGAVLYLLWHYSRGLPDYKQLAKYDPPTVTRMV